MLTFRKQLSAAFTTLIVLTNNAICMNAHICEVGKERNHNGEWKWVLSHPDPCQCTKIVMGGMNTITPKRSFTPIYADRPLISDDTELIRRHYDLHCESKEDDPASTAGSMVQNGDADTTEVDASPSTNIGTTDNSVGVNNQPSEVSNEINHMTTSVSNKPSETPTSTNIATTDSCSYEKQCACNDGNEHIDLIEQTASMSSGIISDNVSGALAANAIDGDTNGNFYSGSCIHTNFEPNPWWKVDIGVSKCIGKVEVYNRVDCCGQRLNDAIVRVGPNQNHVLNSACGSKIGATASTKKVDVECNLNGRYLSIELPKKERLQLCEVKAFGCTICD